MARTNESISFVHSVEYIRVLIAILKSMCEITRVTGVMSYDRAGLWRNQIVGRNMQDTSFSNSSYLTTDIIILESQKTAMIYDKNVNSRVR